MASGRFSGVVIGSGLSGTDNGDGTITVASSGSGIPATIFDAKGDLIAASAADTAGRLPVGSNDQVLVADSGQTLGVKWAAVPGTSAFVPVSTIDAKGDLLVGSAADTVARLAVGTDGQVLTADSAQTLGVKWAASTAAGTPLYTGSGAPSSGLGTTGDLYLDTTGKNFYQKQLIGTSPAFRSAAGTFNASNGVTSLACTMPSGVASGDLLIALVELTVFSGGVTACAAPSGWTRQSEHTVGTTNHAFYTRAADGTEGSTVTFSFATNQHYAAVAILAYSGASFDKFSDYGSSQTGTTPTVPSVTTASANEIVVGLVSSIAGSGTPSGTQASGWTERADRSNTSSLGLAYAMDKAQAAAGASPTATPTLAASGSSIWTWAVAVGGTSPTPTWTIIGALV